MLFLKSLPRTRHRPLVPSFFILKLPAVVLLWLRSTRPVDLVKFVHAFLRFLHQRVGVVMFIF
jgi:hypothetical protein